MLVPHSLWLCPVKPRLEVGRRELVLSYRMPSPRRRRQQMCPQPTIGELHRVN